jgi:biopolymer transport protein ExbD
MAQSHTATAGEQKASALEMKRALTRAKRRHKHDPEINYLNITPMLDMMTIILVFLLKSLASSAGNIPQSDDLRLPRSSSTLDPSGALQVIVSRVSVTVNGRAIGVQLRNGFIDPSQKRGGSAGFLVNPLNSEMRDQAEHARALARQTNTQFKGEIAIIADRDIPLRTVYEVLYTAGQNGFSNFQLLVLKNGAR